MNGKEPIEDHGVLRFRGNSALRAAILTAFGEEVAKLTGLEAARILWDMERVYDHIRIERLLDFLKNMMMVRKYYLDKFGNDPIIINGDQMPLHRYSYSGCGKFQTSEY